MPAYHVEPVETPPHDYQSHRIVCPAHEPDIVKKEQIIYLQHYIIVQAPSK